MNKSQRTILGSFPSYWQVVRIEDLIRDKIIIGHLDGNHGSDYPRSDEFVESGVPYISANSIVNGRVDLKVAKYLPLDRATKLRKGKARNGDVLFAHNATVGPVALLETDEPLVVLSTTLTYYRSNEDRLHNRYLKSFLESDLFRRQYEPLMAQSTRNQVPITTQRKFFVALPPIAVQRKIAEILGAWDEAIATVEWLIAALQQRKTGLMQRLLTGEVRFQRFVKHDGKQETKFGTLPIDWKYVPVGKVARYVSVKNEAGDDLPVLSCTKYDGLVDSLEYFGRQVFADDTSNYKVVSRGQFAYATNHIEEGSIGYQDLYDRALISPMYTVFQTSKRVDDAFLYKVLKTELYRHIFETRTSGTVNRRGSLRWSEFAKIHIPLPSLEEQRAIAEVFALVEREISLAEQQRDKLQEQKKGLMQRLLTGEVRVHFD